MFAIMYLILRKGLIPPFTSSIQPSIPVKLIELVNIHLPHRICHFHQPMPKSTKNILSMMGSSGDTILNFVDSFFSWDYRAGGLGHDQILTVFRTKSITNTVFLELRAAELCEVSCKRLLGNKLPFPFYFSYKSKYFHGN